MIGLIGFLDAQSLVDQKKLEPLKELYRQSPAKALENMIDNKLVDFAKLASLLGDYYGYPQIQLKHCCFEELSEEVRNEKLCKKHMVFPIHQRGKTLFLATADPTNFSPLEDFQFNTGLTAEFVVTSADELANHLEQTFDNLDDTLAGSDLEGMGDIETVDEGEKEGEGDGSDDAPIVVYINKVLIDAIRKGASDLHFEPYEKSYRIRFRIDGVLHEIASPPVQLSQRISARLKVMSRLDIAERRIPQDGRIKLKLSAKKAIDFRVSTCPTLWGEKIVMRILDSSSAMLGIDILGYEAVQKDLYMDALHQPQGMILVTGPTGSGKTVSLYTGLNILNTPERNISTAEDPVEIQLPGINQVQMNPRAGLDFSAALKSFLRQDPDIIMVGEIRDLETAEIAIKAAQTGHLVLSTLHTNSAPETLTRLMNMGVPSYNISSSVSLIIAQRLARRLCGKCKAPEEISRETLIDTGYKEEEVDSLTLYKPVGCEHCTDGYKGRLGIYEVMKISPTIAKIIMDNGTSLDIAEQAQKEGVNNIRQSGLKKAADGLTSLAEVNRVTAG
ncbi:type IV-A pilus assembly ATPase PilB [Algicola sagamiensis]|uniref:type IV-A pilus assembly ATPase PilB n=1 Tax=Algicola sagamiensis TaxID=163869 RepID=UPI00038067A4|nr:type IV-A pilus assembly ATPase PilB [Algicola sagamiensis]